MKQTNKDIFSIIFRERFISLLKDGYLLKVSTDTDTLWLRKLRHMTNGNEIILKAYPKTKCITQTTNGLMKFIGTYD